MVGCAVWLSVAGVSGQALVGPAGKPVRYLQPLGVPEAPADVAGRKPAYLAWVMVKVAGVPAGTDTLRVKVEGLGPGGAPLSDHGERMLPTSAEVVLERAPHLDLSDPGRHTFISRRPILLIADERARTDIWEHLSSAEKDTLSASDPARGIYPLCPNCDRDLDGDGRQDIPWGIAAAHAGLSDQTAGPEPIEIASAGRVRIELESTGSTWLAGLGEDDQLPSAEVGSVAWAASPAVGQTPSGEVRAAAAPEVELATGTVELARTDLSLPAPGLDVSLRRAYGPTPFWWTL